MVGEGEEGVEGEGNEKEGKGEGGEERNLERRGPESGALLVACSGVQVLSFVCPRRESQRGARRDLYCAVDWRGWVLEVKIRHQVLKSSSSRRVSSLEESWEQRWLGGMVLVVEFVWRGMGWGIATHFSTRYRASFGWNQ